jgi:hypothetical protein
MVMNKIFFYSLVFTLFSSGGYGQNMDEGDISNDLDMSSGIFSDFEEDLASRQVQEDERFYRYGRFVSMTMGFGLTTFGGNRGKAFHDENPTFSMGLVYFSDFRNAFNMGIEHSRHTIYLDTPVKSNAVSSNPYGAIDVQLLRPFLAYRYYFETADLGSILTYANPYLIGRIEYWYETKKYRDYDGQDTVKEGGLGASVGAGIEIPTDLDKSFVGFQMLMHKVQLPDNNTEEYQAADAADDATYCQTHKCYGYSDLQGLGYSFITSYVISW